MARLALLFVTGLPFLAIGFGIGMWWATRTPPASSERELEFRERMATLQHHTELLERSRQASRSGDAGLANIYAEAADRVLDLADRQRDD